MNGHNAELEIQELRAEHYVELTDFFERNNVESVTHNFHPFPSDAQTAHRLCTYRGKDLYFVAVTKNTIVGLVMLRGWDEGYKTPSFGLLVDRQHQGRGIARTLAEFAIERAKSSGCHLLRLTVYSDNLAALRLYKSLGFEECEGDASKEHSNTRRKIVMFKDLTS